MVSQPGQAGVADSKVFFNAYLSREAKSFYFLVIIRVYWRLFAVELFYESFRGVLSGSGLSYLKL